MAKRMVKEAAAAGADCVKFQKTSLEHRARILPIIINSSFLSENFDNVTKGRTSYN